MSFYLEETCNIPFDFAYAKLAEDVIAFCLSHENFPYEAEVSVSIVSKEEIHEINKKFRQVDRPTDVLSFPMLEFEYPGDFSSETFENSLTTSFESQELLLGDIVLCTDIIKSQAKEYGHSEKREFSFLVVHSLLHLLGYDHMEEEERVQMEEHQREIMSGLKIGRGGSDE